MDNRKNEEIKIAHKITVHGIVQGVGFRPFVFNLAKKHGINGSVKNLGGLVEIITNSTQSKFDQFLNELKTSPCPGSQISSIEIQILPTIPKNQLDTFQILSSEDEQSLAILPPDLPICSDCVTDLLDPNNRRYLNPFVSCMSCGPRYSIMEALPYDRHTTTMVDYDMCEKCQQEYLSPTNRRFYAQTISCHDCGPSLIFHATNLTSAIKCERKYALSTAIDLLKEDKVIAVKGIGGYHYACSPYSETAVKNLRELKAREAKPFAVMFPNIDEIKSVCEVSEKEKQLLTSSARPIVLLKFKNDPFASNTCQESAYCGAFLPYTPLQILLLNKCGPLIMTSANISGSSIICDDDEILSVKSPLLSGVLYHKRRIARPVEDSVAKIANGNEQIIRRSRGYVPYPFYLPNIPSPASNEILAMGSDLKACFGFHKDGAAILSQFYGDLENNKIFEQYKRGIDDLSKLTNIAPKKIVCDLHPGYFSTKLAPNYSQSVIKVQHHHAHIASVMAEHNLKTRVIGVSFDGTGYGTDGSIWGGEFLICEKGEFIRVGHLRNVTLIGGDTSMKDAKKTATCYLIGCGQHQHIEDSRAPIISAAIQNNINTFESSSMGRLFDAISSILKIKDTNTFEGECAGALEKQALFAVKNNEKPAPLHFNISDNDGKLLLSYETLFDDIYEALKTHSVAAIALGFHIALANATAEICSILREKYDSNTVALSGGVFQNTLLIEQTFEKLKNNKFNVYTNQAVPPNDGGLALGQIYIALQR